MAAITVKKAVKESLVGTEDTVPQVTSQCKSRFTANAIKDPETGELYLGPVEFTNAIAPADEDYVCFLSLFFFSPLLSPFLLLV